MWQGKTWTLICCTRITTHQFFRVLKGGAVTSRVYCLCLRGRQTNLVSGHTILFHLLKFTLELILPLSFLLCAAHIHLSAIKFFAVHVVHSLQWNKQDTTETDRMDSQHQQQRNRESSPFNAPERTTMSWSSPFVHPRVSRSWRSQIPLICHSHQS